MNTSELKLNLFRQIDLLDEDQLEALYGLITNFLNKERSIDDWQEMTEEQKQGLLGAITQIENGEGRPHREVVQKYRKKYANG